MIEYAITALKNISFASNSPDSVWLPYFILGGIVTVAMGYWIKQTMGAFIAAFSVVLADLYFAGYFNRII